MRNGIGFVGMLTVLFIGLKLASVIDWSWWWVLSPVWINILVALFLVIVYCILEYHNNKPPKIKRHVKENRFQRKMREMQEKKP